MTTSILIAKNKHIIMETKKSKSADLERRRGAFFSLGLVLGASLILMAFTYNSVSDNSTAQFHQSPGGLEAEPVPIPIDPPKPEPVKPEAAPPPPMIEDIEVVENEVEVEDFTFVDPEDLKEPSEPEEFAIDPSEPFVEVPDVEPSFPGGEPARINYIQDNFHFEEVEMDLNMGCSGTVYVTFVVGSNGKISDIKLLRGVCDGIDAEVMRITKAMPDWIPGEQAGKKVKCRFTMRIALTNE